ncbi:MAG: L-seryl-tRNA(Sec) selenium transferase [Alphaproteobacteria bacterium]
MAPPPTSPPASSPQSALPSVDRLLGSPIAAGLIGKFGRPLVTDAVREVLAELRGDMEANGGALVTAALEDDIIERVSVRLAKSAEPSLRAVFNLTGTVIHTNLGRAPLPSEAIEAVADVARGASNLEYDLKGGRRGDRDSHVEDWLCRLTGAEAATVVNNNAAAVLLVLNSLALRKEVPVSRGELIEIGGSFRMPDIMTRAGCKLKEVGTTNRTHLGDFAEAIGPSTAMIMKVHASNYSIEGFSAEVDEDTLAELAHRHDLPLVIDLGSGTLVDLAQFGLPHEPTAAETLAHGADVVTFSGDKLLGGPQAGIIVGRADLIARIKRNPMKRALRLDKMTIAALGAVLPLYGNPERLVERVPVLRLLARPAAELEAMAVRLQPALALRLGDAAVVACAPCQSQIGSGSLPTAHIDSHALVMTPAGRRGAGAQLKRLAAAFRALPMPVIGRIHDDGLWLDLRCLEDEAKFTAQLAALRLDPASST